MVPPRNFKQRGHNMSLDPTLSEILEYVDNLNLDIAEDNCDFDASMSQFDLYKAIYFVAIHHHGGQWSNLYSVIAQTRFRPGAFEKRLPNEDDEPLQTELYNELADWIVNG